MKYLLTVMSVFCLAAAPLSAEAGAYEELSLSCEAAGIGQQDQAAVPVPAAVEQREAVQELPPNNDEPGFNWPAAGMAKDALAPAHFVYTGRVQAALKLSPDDVSPAVCDLSPGTLYETAYKPDFEGDYLRFEFYLPVTDCPQKGGYLSLLQVSSSSAGGLWELPRPVRAFLDTLAYAEGTDWHYNYIYTFATFDSYAAHPARRICAGSLCSTAAGRYQFLSSTWAPLASDLALGDFSPPNQDKACLETIRRAGAYGLVKNSYKYENFSAALTKLNKIWASLPGSPYGQPTHSRAELWKAYQAALAR